MSTSKPNEAWVAFQNMLTPETRAALEQAKTRTLPVEEPEAVIEDEEVLAYRKFVSTLTPETREALRQQAAHKPVAAAPKVPLAVARYGIVESPDGEWAQMRLFKTSEGLARRVAKLEGTDTIVWCFFGVPIPMTKGPQRLLLLPGETEAIQVPVYEGGPCAVVPVSDPDELVLEKTGFVGPKELAEAPPTKQALEAKAALSGDDDDDE